MSSRVPASLYSAFSREWHKGGYQYERYGQAFLNKFHDYEIVTAQRSNSTLWECKSYHNAEYLIEHELQLIDWET